MNERPYRLAVWTLAAVATLGAAVVASNPSVAQRVLTLVQLQPSSPGRMQDGHIHVSGSVLAGRVGIGTFQPPQERLEVDGNVKATALVASRYPRLVALRQNSVPGAVFFNNEQQGWIDVPVDDRDVPMQTTVLVSSTSDVFQCSYQLRCDLQAPGFNAVGIRIANTAGNIVYTRIGDGTDSLDSPTVLRAAGTIMVTGLAPGQYTFRLASNATAGTRVFSEQRQFSVYQVR